MVDYARPVPQIGMTASQHPSRGEERGRAQQCRAFVTSYTDEPATTISSLVVTNTATGKQVSVRAPTQCGKRGVARGDAALTKVRGRPVGPRVCVPLPTPTAAGP